MMVASFAFAFAAFQHARGMVMKRHSLDFIFSQISFFFTFPRNENGRHGVGRL